MIRPFLCAILAAAVLACREAKSPTGPTPQGPDNEGPEVSVQPALDTLVDALGTLDILVVARDRSNIKRLALDITGVGYTFLPLFPNDTVFTVIFPITLSPLKNSSFAYLVRAVDVLDHVTVTDTVTVTVQ